MNIYYSSALSICLYAILVRACESLPFAGLARRGGWGHDHATGWPGMFITTGYGKTVVKYIHLPDLVKDFLFSQAFSFVVMRGKHVT